MAAKTAKIDNNFRCIECRSASDCLYTEFSNGIMKLKQCEMCNEAVDKYIEYDHVLIFLDVLLHKPQAFCHLVFNGSPTIPVLVQLLVLNTFSDTYMRLNAFHKLCPSDLHSPDDWHMVLEAQFYVMLAIAISDLMANAIVTTGVTLFSKYQQNIANNMEKQCSNKILQALIISSYGKLFALPLLIWEPGNSYWSLLILKVFVTTSNAIAIKVTSNRSFVESLSYLSCGLLSGFLIEKYAMLYMLSIIEW